MTYRIKIRTLLIFVVSLGVLTAFGYRFLATNVFADCNNCQWGCSTSCDSGFSSCDGDCHCCSHSSAYQQEHGVGCGCYECGNCHCSDPPPPPPCDCDDPGNVSLSSPTNGSTNLPNTPTLSWSGPGNWHECCDDCSRHYEVRYRRAGTSSWIEPSGACRNPGRNTHSCVMDTLQWCTTYEWRVRADNGCQSGDWSPTWTFRTSCPPTFVSAQAVNTSCSSSWSGQYNNGANNPLSIQARVTDPDGGNTISAVFLALRPDQADDIGDAGCQLWERRMARTFGMNYRVSDGHVTIVMDEEPSSGCPWDYTGDAENDNFIVESASHSISGNSLTLNVTLRFKDNFRNGIYKFFGMARDNAGSYSCSINPGSPCYDERSPWNVDVEPPSTRVDIYHVAGEPADSLHFDQIVQDNDDRESGVKSVFDRYYDVLRGGSTTQCDIADGNCSDPDGDPVTPPTPRDEWTIPTTRRGFRGGDDVSATIVGEDNACNISQPVANTVDTVMDRWMRTRFGDTYSALGYNIPIQPVDVPFATYWVGGGTSSGSWNFNVGKASSKNWIDGSYDDDNKDINWYNELRRLARKSEWLASHDVQTLSAGTGVIDISGIGGDGIFEYSGGNDVRITGDCSGKKVIFVTQSGIDVTVEPDIHVVDDNSACILIASGDIEISAGGNAGNPPAADEIEMAFVTGGEFRTPEDPEFNRLIIRGFVIADRTNFGRDLVYEVNTNYPAELIDYDPRYLYLLKDMLGRRPFEDFGCGTVRGEEECTGWEE